MKRKQRKYNYHEGGLEIVIMIKFGELCFEFLQA